jgi:hypothetical protein
MKQSSVLAVLMAVGTAGSVWAADTVVHFGMVGIVGQTARLNVVNTAIGNPNESACLVELMFFDSEGTQLTRKEQRLLGFGKAASLDYGDPNLLERSEIRASVRKFDNPATKVNECRDVIATVEVFDNDTKRTAVLYTDPDQ